MSAAAAISANPSSGTITPSTSFRISYLPMQGRFAPMCFFEVASVTYTDGTVIFFTTSRVNVLPTLSCSVSWNTIESPVIFTT